MRLRRHFYSTKPTVKKKEWLKRQKDGGSANRKNGDRKR